MNRISFAEEQIVGVIRTHCDPNFDGEFEILPSKRGSAALVTTELGRFVVKYADLANLDTEQHIIPSRSAGIRNETVFLRRVSPELAPELYAAEEDRRSAYSIIRFAPGEPLQEAEPSDGNYATIISALITSVTTLHDTGIIHGDLTPSNALFWENKVTLVDFELAHGLGEAALAPGMYHYLSPEAATAIVDGNVPELDVPEETFSLAMTCLSILARQLPIIYPDARVSRTQALQNKATGNYHYSLEGVADKDTALAKTLISILESPADERPQTTPSLHESIKEYL